MLSSLHDNHGDEGVEHALQLVRPRCYWQCVAKDIEKWCHECGTGILAKAVQPKVRPFMGSIQASRPQVVIIDFIVLEPASNDREIVLLVTDFFSKFTQAIPTKEQQASTVLDVLVKY